MPEIPACESCRVSMVALLDARIRQILAIAEEEGEETLAAAESQCFHLMEIQRILQGQETSGVFDDFGAPPTITGPLFQAPASEVRL